MGNSITIGWLNSRPEFFKGKPLLIAVLAAKLPHKCLLGSGKM
ncbi:hypothetical protein [Maribacter confluentis]